MDCAQAAQAMAKTHVAAAAVTVFTPLKLRMILTSATEPRLSASLVLLDASIRLLGAIGKKISPKREQVMPKASLPGDAECTPLVNRVAHRALDPAGG